MSTGPIRPCLAAVLALSTLACSETPSPKGTTQIVPAGQPPIGGIADTAVVPAGVVVGFTVVSSGPTGGAGTATVDDPTIVSLLPTSVDGTYVLVGRFPGNTTLRAVADGADPTAMPLVVELQTPEP